MSWSISLFGKPDKIVEALKAESEKQSGQSKVEFDAALPHMSALVSQNFGDDYPVQLTASGHGQTVGGELTQSTVNVEVKKVYSRLV